MILQTVIQLFGLAIGSAVNDQVSDPFSVNAFWATDVINAPFVYMKSSMIVPPLPPSEWQTLFLWPGLQPRKSPTFLPIDNGVLQPVLTFGPSCAPNPNNLNIDRNKFWWISAQYVNTFGKEPGFTGCRGGNQIKVMPGDVIEMIMELQGQIWNQTVIVNKKDRVDYQISLRGQAQGRAEWIMETPGGWHRNVPVFRVFDIEMRVSKPIDTFCTPTYVVKDLPGASLSCSNPVTNGTICKVSECKFNYK